MRRRRGDKPTPAQHQAVMENLIIGQMVRLQNQCQHSGHYDFQQKVRELEEQFRSKTGRKEKD